MPRCLAVSASFQLFASSVLTIASFSRAANVVGPFDAGDEHRLAQLERAHPQRPEPAAQRGEPRHQVRRVLGQVHADQRLARLLVGVEQPALDVEHDDPLAEPVEQGLGERGEDGWKRIEWKRVWHDRRIRHSGSGVSKVDVESGIAIPT